MQKIEDVVSGVIEAMRSRGIKEYSIKCISWSIYCPIINYHHNNGSEFYSGELLDRLCKQQQARCENGEIGRKYYRSFETAAFRIRSYVDTGEVNFSVVKDSKRYKPKGEFESLVDLVLNATGVTIAQQYKLSITIRQFFCFLEKRHTKIGQITDRDFLDFIPEAAKRNPNNMSCVMRALRYVSQYLNDRKWAEIKTDFSVFRPQSLPIRMITPYSQEEINAVLEEINSGSTKTPKRDYAIILLAFNSGLRCADIRKLKLTDIDWKKQELRIVQKKTGKPLSAPLNGKTLNAIAEYILKERPRCSDSYVFLRAFAPYTAIKSTSPLDYMIDKYCRLASIEKISYRSFHSLRRAFGTELAKAEVPVTSISQMLGHSDMSSDKAYLSFNKTQTALCSADFSEVPITTAYMPLTFCQTTSQGKKSPNTVEAYRYTLNIYLEFLQAVFLKELCDITVKDFSQKNILHFIEWLTDERGNKASTANLRLIHLKRFCQFLMGEDILMISELSAIQKIAKLSDVTAEEVKFLTIQETKLILSQPNTEKLIGLRDSFFMHLLYDSGCRIQEMMDLKLKDFVVQTGGAELHIIGKGNKFRVTPISEELCPMFYQYCNHYHKIKNYDNYLFYIKRNGILSQMPRDTAQAFVEKYGAMARQSMPAIPHIHPHLFRHTRAMHLYMAGMPLELVSQWLGHSQLETTLIYARATTEMKRKAVDKISIKENSVFKDDEKFKYADDDAIIKQLYGLT